jgi:hypothetical protein
MKTIENLKQELKLAYNKNLIHGYENSTNRDMLLILLKENTSDHVVIKLKDYIKSTYKDISYVHSVKYNDAPILYIRYIDCL